MELASRLRFLLRVPLGRTGTLTFIESRGSHRRAVRQHATESLHPFTAIMVPGEDSSIRKGTMKTNSYRLGLIGGLLAWGIVLTSQTAEAAQTNSWLLFSGKWEN